MSRSPLPACCRALACDGDGTLTTNKVLAKRTHAALDRWQASGRRLILVTGETVKQLAKFPEHRRFDLVVAENGAVLYHPRSRRTTVLVSAGPQSRLVKRLRALKVAPLTVGRVVVSTHRMHDEQVRTALRDLGIQWRLLYNRHEIMALPQGIDKSTGLCAALKRLRLPRRVVVGVGDGENDTALLRCCGFGVAVRGAVPSLKKAADLVLEQGSGSGIVRLVSRLLAGGAACSVNGRGSDGSRSSTRSS